MARPALSPEQRAESESRAREAILLGLTRCIVRRDYASTTVSDIAAAGKVSKSRIYALFGDKEDILVALYTSLVELSIDAVNHAVAGARRDQLSWRRRLRVGVEMHVRTVFSSPELARCVLIEAPAASARVREARRASLVRYADLLALLAAQVSEDEGVPSDPTHALATGAVAGVAELLLEAMEDPLRTVDDVADDATELLAHVFLASDPARREDPRGPLYQRP